MVAVVGADETKKDSARAALSSATDRNAAASAIRPDDAAAVALELARRYGDDRWPRGVVLLALGCIGRADDEVMSVFFDGSRELLLVRLLEQKRLTAKERAFLEQLLSEQKEARR